MIPVLGIVAATIDFGRAGKVKSTLETAASSAAQAASAALGSDSDAVEDAARRMLMANLPGDLKTLPHKVTIAKDRQSVEVSLATTVPTTLLAIMGKREIAVEAHGFARRVVPQLPQAAAAGAAREPLAGLPAGGARNRFGGAEPEPIQLDAPEVEAAIRKLADDLQKMQGGGNIDVEAMMRELRKLR